MTDNVVKNLVYVYLTDLMPTIVISPHLDLVDDLGLDMLDIIEMIMYLEQNLKISINDGDPVLSSKTVDDLVTHVYEKTIA